MLIKLDDAIAAAVDLQKGAITIRGPDFVYDCALADMMQALRALPVSDGWGDIAIQAAIEAAIPEPTHLYEECSAEYVQHFKNATAIDRLAFESLFRKALAALGPLPAPPAIE